MGWEEAAVRWVNGLANRSPILDAFVYQLAEGIWPLVIAGIAVIAWVWRGRLHALLGAATLAAAIGVGDFIGMRVKLAVARPRPCQVWPDWERIVGCGDAFSMPSNHVLNNALAAAFLQVLYPWTGWVMWPLVALQCGARLYVAAHYPTDLLVGVAMGAALGVCSGLLFRRWRDSRRESAVETGPTWTDGPPAGSEVDAGQ